jgi:hypothetical protein
MRTYKPALVVMYGMSEKKHWEKPSEGRFLSMVFYHFSLRVFAFY